MKSSEAKKAYNRARHWRHREANIARSRAWQLANPRTPEKAAYAEKRRRMRQYKLTAEQAEVSMVASQGDFCAYCREFAPLVVDHNHTTGQVRGMVCQRCNQIAGAIEDPKFNAVKTALERSAEPSATRLL